MEDISRGWYVKNSRDIPPDKAFTLDRSLFLYGLEKVDYDAEKIAKHPSVLAISPTLDPGKSAEFVLTPKMLDKPGFYPYVCLIPGHADMLGMKGVLHVK